MAVEAALTKAVEEAKVEAAEIDTHGNNFVLFCFDFPDQTDQKTLPHDLANNWNRSTEESLRMK